MPENKDKLTSLDKRLIRMIYEMRTVDRNIASEFIYGPKTDERVNELIHLGILEEEEYSKNGDKTLFLTTEGINYAKENHNCYGLKPLQRAQLKIKSQNVSHQLHLNHFSLSLMEKLKNVDYRYFDGKFMPKCSDFMMPDGMIEIDGAIYLLEMDMGSENYTDLLQKWNNYRGFLSHKPEYYEGKDIICVFILADLKRVDDRIAHVAKSIETSIMDYLGPQFDICVGQEADLLKHFGTTSLDRDTLSALSILRNIHGFSASTAKIAPDHDFYIRILGTNKKVIMRDGKQQEYLFDSWLDFRAKVLKNIQFHAKTDSFLRDSIGRPISYIVLVKDEKWVCKMMKTGRLVNPGNVYFTTITRLKEQTFHDALFQAEYMEYNDSYTIYSFSDNGLQDRVEERTIRFRK